jgi:hypothetical protein
MKTIIAGPGGLHADKLTSAERLNEIGDILAAGLMRLSTSKSSRISSEIGESSLHFTPDQSGAADRNSPEVVS